MADHERAVAALRDSYHAVPEGQPVRLAKRTTNLFRPRTSTTTAGLDVSGLTGVLNVDGVNRTADVQGMCTYEHLVDATLPHGLMPLVVPQLKTITIGGAVTGLGIESTSFRHGMPHESVLEADVFTGAGELVTATPDGPHADLFAALPNSLGSLGYTTRLRIELQPIKPYVELRNIAFTDVDALLAAIAEIATTGSWDGEAVDAMDAVMFALDDLVLVLARFSDEAEPAKTSDYTGQAIFYQSLREKRTDRLTAAQYLWRWDTDWFWVSRAFGAQHPVVRRLWPARYRRSDVYHRMMTFEQRHGWWARLERRRGRPERERVVQDVEIPVARTGEFLRWFARRVGMSPVWLCPIRVGRSWPLFPLEPGVTYVNAGFWGTVPIAPGASDGDINKAVEDKVEVLDGHKTLYSDAYYTRATFDRLYGADVYQALKKRYDPDNRLTGLYEKVVQRR